MATYRYSKWGIAAITGGVALTAVEVIGAVSYLVSQAQPSYLIAGGAIVTVVAAILPILAERCWRDRRRLLAILLWVALLPALSVIFTAAVERTGGARDDANRERQASAQKIELAREAVQDAKAVAERDESAAKAECATGRGPKCQGLEARADKSRERLEAARTAQAQAGVISRDPMAVRLAAVLPVSEEAVALYQPLVLPLSISALGLLLIAVGAHQPAHAPPKRRKARKPRKSSPKGKTPKAKAGTAARPPLRLVAANDR